MRSPSPGIYPADVDWGADLGLGRPLFALLDETASRHGERPATDFFGKRTRWRALRDDSERLAGALQARGLCAKGARIGLFLPNSPLYIVAFFAVLRAGGTVVNFNPLYADAELRHQIADAGVETMITLDLAALCDPLRPLVADGTLKQVVVGAMTALLPFPKSVLFPLLKRRECARLPAGAAGWLRLGDLLAAGGPARPVAIDPATDIAVLQYTGGTTGTPKGAMLTHDNLVANTRQAVLWFPHVETGRERTVAVLPFFHVFAMTSILNFMMAIAGEMVLMPRFELKALLKAIHKARPTVFAGVPTIFNAINKAPDLARYDLSSIKACISGGAPLPVEIKAEFERLTGCVLVEGYGLTESSPVAVCNPLTGVNKAGSIGLPLPQTTVEIVSLEDRESPMPVGERGEVCLTGPQVMAGYWRQPAESAKVLRGTRGRRLHTGDVGYVDADGYVFLVDRIKDLILASGYNVYPRNVEEAIYQHPAVAECVVIGVPDEYRGQTVKAFIALRDGHSLTEAELAAFLTTRLSPMERPKSVEFRATLPKTLIGKLSKKALADEEAARRARS